MEAIDYTNRLGFAKMPEDYKLLWLDSGHFMWIHENSHRESCINWNRWVVYKSAWQDFKGLIEHVK